jgi:NAD(P)-dependent dehydrogenase (short-subunit alcohol dehydrogenase family)
LEITNKVIVVTGGAGGIGLAIAKEFIKEGPKIVILVDISFKNFNFKDKKNFM